MRIFIVLLCIELSNAATCSLSSADTCLNSVWDKLLQFSLWNYIYKNIVLANTQYCIGATCATDVLANCPRDTWPPYLLQAGTYTYLCSQQGNYDFVQFLGCLSSRGKLNHFRQEFLNCGQVTATDRCEWASKSKTCVMAIAATDCPTFSTLIESAALDAMLKPWVEYYCLATTTTSSITTTTTTRTTTTTTTTPTTTTTTTTPTITFNTPERITTTPETFTTTTVITTDTTTPQTDITPTPYITTTKEDTTTSISDTIKTIAQTTSTTSVITTTKSDTTTTTLDTTTTKSDTTTTIPDCTTAKVDNSTTIPDCTTTKPDTTPTTHPTTLISTTTSPDTTTTTSAPNTTHSTTPHIPATRYCYKCKSGYAVKKCQRCPAPGDTLGWQKTKVVKCTGPCVITTSQTTSGEHIERGCSDGKFPSTVIQPSGFVTYLGKDTCFCSRDRCN